MIFAWQSCIVCDNSAWCVTFNRCITGRQHAQPPIARCGPAGLSHWRFRVQIITLFTKIKITLRSAYNTRDTAIKVICTLLPAVQARASIHSLRQSLQIQKISKVALSTLCTASHNHTLDICRIVCTWSTRSPDKCAKPHQAIKLQFLTLIETQDSPVTYVIYK